MTARTLTLLAGLSLLMTGCETSSPPVQFAADQVLRLVASQDVQTLDPAKIHQPSVELSLARNVFGGLYRFRDDLVEEPDLAARMPDISSDGLTWTFHLRTNARFSNGNPVKAADVLYSWNRMAALVDYASSIIFEVVAGYSEVLAGRSKGGLSGLSAPDDYTVVAKLTAPAGWWLAELGLWSAAVIDKNVVGARGEDTWWTTPEGLVGTGPFRMTNRNEGRSLDFEPVANWWGGSTGRLKQVHVDVIADQAVQVSRYAAGDYDIVGYTPNDASAQVSAATVNRFRGDSHLRDELRMHPWFKTYLLGFRGEGRLGTDADVPVRRALSLALDRGRLAEICLDGAQCAPATGGLITKGLAGYLGDGADPNSKYDVQTAKSLFHTWDPSGSRLSTIRIGTLSRLFPLAAEVKAEWQTALGIDVRVEVNEGQNLFRNARQGLYDVTISANLADFDSPENWFTAVPGACHAAIVNPQFIALLAAADPKLPTDALSDYKKAGQLLADIAACPALVYLQAVHLIKPWVKGAGGNGLYENYWTGISILKH
ncbi:MAG TPA: ABC transporter substrate-binding protein [Candidatus Dormibacteraeota bacterium]|nr:ABC transporter substrate-binding protein [Candidatus Dormibacteraeota bacterium]